MKRDSYAAARCGLVIAVLLCVLAGSIEAKPIRLRNEVITPPARTQQGSAMAQASASPAASGLFLVQFTETPRPEWRQQLETLGVELLRYVPDDAWVADLNNVPLGQLRQLGFVTWVGPYRPEHKVHRNLQVPAVQAAGGVSVQAAPAEPLDVSVLLSPRAEPQDAASVKTLLQQVQQESKLRSGTILRGRISPAQLSALAQSRAVLWIEPSPRMKLFDEVSSKIVAGDGGPNTLYAQSLGYDGRGVKVAVADSGLDSGDTNSMHPDIQGRVSALLHYGAPGQLADAADEHSHGRHCTGIIAGNDAPGETDAKGAAFALTGAEAMSFLQQLVEAAARQHLGDHLRGQTRRRVPAGGRFGLEMGDSVDYG